MKTNEETSVEELERAIEAKLERALDLVKRSGTRIDENTLAQIVFPQLTPAEVKYSAIRAMLPLVEAACRGQQNLEDDQEEPIGLWNRYPAMRMRNGKLQEFYVLRAYLSPEERALNVERLRREAESLTPEQAKLRSAHAARLEAEGRPMEAA